MSRPLGLFEGFGIELEYMIVDRETLAVRPLAAEVLRDATGRGAGEIERDRLAWSNELVSHVVELKTNGPASRLEGLSDLFHQDIREINRILDRHGARLMPTAMHPWMDPATETELWPHASGEVYATFDRIFDCRGHGWANLQSIHINLPFSNDEDFGRLHAAIRMVLPILPALAASSPIVESRATGIYDNRLDFYRQNCRRVPAVTGAVIPERVFTRADYENGLLAGLYRDIAPFDPAGVLRHEWLNSRGAIARFDRSAIEIRLLDVQECPRADLAVVSAVVEVVRALVEERLSPGPRQRAWPEERLARILEATVRGGTAAVLDDADYLRDMGFPGAGPVTAGEFWRYLVEAVGSGREWPEREALQTILDQGCLAGRILSALGPEISREPIARVYRRLCDGLAENHVFDPSV